MLRQPDYMTICVVLSMNKFWTIVLQKSTEVVGRKITLYKSVNAQEDEILVTSPLDLEALFAQYYFNSV